MLNVKRLHRVWTERGKEREKERGEGAIQSRILDFSLQWFRLCLTLAAAQSNMPLCWRERAMETWFLLFFSWLNPWLVVNTKRSCCLNIICYENASSTRRGNHRWISTPFLHVWSAFKPVLLHTCLGKKKKNKCILRVQLLIVSVSSLTSRHSAENC